MNAEMGQQKSGPQKPWAMSYDVVWTLIYVESMDNCHVNQARGCQCSLWGSKTKFPSFGVGEGEACPLPLPAPGGWHGPTPLMEAYHQTSK